jgi:HEAT repeat protein
VRGEAARAAGWSDHGSEVVDDLVSVLVDHEPYVRCMAARSLGYLRAGQAFEALLPLLADSDAKVRLTAVNALERLDAHRLAARPELTDLAHDPDPGVVRAAERVR